MLKSIDIENIAVIEKSSIELMDAFNVLSGETGAGKSIIIDSINAVLGERTSKDLIRTGSKKAMVCAVFEDISKKAQEFLEENGIPYDGSLIISRVLNLDGKNICRLNGIPCTVSMLKEIGKWLVNIHGQHDNQALLNPDNHIHYIDAFADNDKIKNEYLKDFLKLRDIKKELKRLDVDENEKLNRIDLLKYQIDEIEKANIELGEIAKLNNRKKLITNMQKIILLLKDADCSLNGGDEADGAAYAVRQSASALSNLAEISEEYSEISEQLLNVSEELNTVSDSVRQLTENFEFDPSEIEKIEERLNMYFEFSKKYGKTEEEILNYLEEAKTELKQIEFSDERYQELLNEQDVFTEKVYNKGLLLTESRKKSAEKFCKSVCEILTYLEMPNVTLKAEMSQGIYTKNGCDKLELLISANLGEAAKPLSKIASGGELSRIMLSIKSVMAEKDNVETLIFDEIDTGISGKTAAKVGKQLKLLSNSHQVICVTHLAQIAAAAKNHMLIEKSVSDNKTYTTVKPLLEEDRINEIARIISGEEVTENVYNTAKELLNSY